MSEKKREELIAAGRLNEDGSRIELCPTCHHPLTAEEYAAITGSGVANAEAVVVGAVDGNADVIEITDSDVRPVGDVLDQGD